MQNFNGEALNFNSSQRLKRAIDQLIGICSGIAADGELNNAEISFLATWLSNNQDVCTEFPGKQIAERITAVLADGVVTAEERSDLLELLQQISGNHFVETGAAEAEAAAVPGDAVETIIFEGRRFCFTGKFAYGNRKQCEQAVIVRGGLVEGSVTLALDYLVLGVGVSKDWKHESYGRKIERAVEIREGGAVRPVIVAEKDWVALLEESGNQMNKQEIEVMDYFSNGAVSAGSEEIKMAIDTIKKQHPEMDVAEITALVFEIAEHLLSESSRYMNAEEIVMEFSGMFNK